ncbi:diaminopropionate ammonia-lyase [Brevibacillus brevis]|uniref:diaminopropionate ammonia-lyase n=1 Tax=Brevibacillus brevis TaxID=1393 RepID=UPI00190267AC|nr:diaminopropionate ammonia-lyase [Brevibacillus brevis]MBH0330869.1 diaminopropionate ammonia-lyase [Brevibacillus brevis]
MDKRNQPPIYVVKNKRKNSESARIPAYLTPIESRFAKAFHQSLANYEPTPLVTLPALARELGVGQVLVKDESKRFGLNAFKVLGASYAMARFLCEKLGISTEEMTFEALCSREVKERIGEVTFVTATDGNHGRAVAWAAKALGQHAVVYLPKGSAQQRVDAIREAGAQAHVINGNYDEAVRLSEQMAKEHGWQVIQDTAWEGYTTIPTWIMQGYTTMAAEAMEQLSATADAKQPTHLFLQAGVGSMAAAVLGHFVAAQANKNLTTVIVEPHSANCMVLSVEKNDGQPHAATGELGTIMAGLACGEPNPLAWEILQEHADFFVSCADYVAANGMRILAAPTGGDPSIVSGESGAVGVGLLATLMSKPMYHQQREQLGLHENSVVLCFSTEGDTDQDIYKRIIWEGACREEGEMTK